MVANFKTCGISRGVSKLTQTPTLIYIKNSSYFMCNLKLKNHKCDRIMLKKIYLKILKTKNNLNQFFFNNLLLVLLFSYKI